MSTIIYEYSYEFKGVHGFGEDVDEALQEIRESTTMGHPAADIAELVGVKALENFDAQKLAQAKTVPGPYDLGVIGQKFLLQPLLDLETDFEDLTLTNHRSTRRGQLGVEEAAKLLRQCHMLDPDIDGLRYILRDYGFEDLSHRQLTKAVAHADYLAILHT